MFTGIIESLGEVKSLQSGVILLEPSSPMGRDPIRIGESIAVNGCCLTVVSLDAGLEFELSPETLARTSLSALTPGAHVNLERAMPADGRFGGHIVQGHVDAAGEVVSRIQDGNSTVFRFRVPKGSEKYVIDKGSITVDGISLTVVEPNDGEFDVWVIPHTLANTNLGDRKPGDSVNLEFDVLARYVERLMRP